MLSFLKNAKGDGYNTRGASGVTITLDFVIDVYFVQIFGDQGTSIHWVEVNSKMRINWPGARDPFEEIVLKLLKSLHSGPGYFSLEEFKGPCRNRISFTQAAFRYGLVRENRF